MKKRLFEYFVEADITHNPFSVPLSTVKLTGDSVHSYNEEESIPNRASPSTGDTYLTNNMDQ